MRENERIQLEKNLYIIGLCLPWIGAAVCLLYGRLPEGLAAKKSLARGEADLTELPLAKAIEATPWAVGFGGSQASVFTHLVQTPGRCFSTTSSACVTVVGCGLPKLRQTQGHMADALG